MFIPLKIVQVLFGIWGDGDTVGQHNSFWRRGDLICLHPKHRLSINPHQFVERGVSRRKEIIVIFLIYDFASIKIPSEVSTPSIISFHILYNVFFSNNFTSIYIFSKSLKDFLCEDLSNFFL